MKLEITNAVRLLQSEGIHFELRAYDVASDQHLSATEVALAIGEDPAIIYKTLVLTGQVTPYLVAVIPANSELDLKKIAKVSGNKKCEMLPMKELLPTTGYVRGGCSPIGLKKPFPIFIEEMALLEERIIISAGRKGLQIVITPQDLIRITQAQTADIAN